MEDGRNTQMTDDRGQTTENSRGKREATTYDALAHLQLAPCEWKMEEKDQKTKSVRRGLARLV
jgi:hypothetical protein